MAAGRAAETSIAADAAQEGEGARTRARRSRTQEWAELCMDGAPVSCEHPRRRRIGGLEGG